MKKKLLLLLTFGFLAACSDDDALTPGQQLSKVYRDNELVIRYNGGAVSDKTVQLLTDDLKQAEITFNYLIPGESPLVCGNVALQAVTGKAGSYSFSGKNTNTDREISFTGTVGKTMEIEVTYKSLSPAVGIWLPYADMETLTYPLEFRITPVSPDATIDMHGFMGAELLPLVGAEGSLESVIKTMGSVLFSLIVTPEFNLNESGGLQVAWKPGLFGGTIPILPGETEDGMVHYNVYQNRVFAAIALDKLLSPKSRAELSPELIEKLYQLGRIAYTGLPLNLSFPDEQRMTVSLNREMMLPYVPVVTGLLAELVKDVNIEAVGGLIKITGEQLSGVILELGRVIVESPEFEIVLNLGRKSAATFLSGLEARAMLNEWIRNNELKN